MKRALLALSLFLFPIIAHAEWDVKTFLKVYDAANPAEKQYMEQRLTDIQYGMSWANAVLITEKKIPIYCAPANLVLTGQQLFNILRREIDTQTPEAAFPFGLIMITALKIVFPCPKNSN